MIILVLIAILFIGGLLAWLTDRFELLDPRWLSIASLAICLFLLLAFYLNQDAVFILGHTGYDSKEKALTYVDSAIYLAQIYPNVYVEPGALGAERAVDVIDDYVVRLKEGNILDKVIYGSDGVQFPGYLKEHLEHYVAAMERNGYTAEDMTAVLSGNFSRLFGIDIPGLAELQASFTAEDDS